MREQAVHRSVAKSDQGPTSSSLFDCSSCVCSRVFLDRVSPFSSAKSGTSSTRLKSFLVCCPLSCVGRKAVLLSSTCGFCQSHLFCDVRGTTKVLTLTAPWNCSHDDECFRLVSYHTQSVNPTNVHQAAANQCVGFHHHPQTDNPAAKIYVTVEVLHVGLTTTVNYE